MPHKNKNEKSDAPPTPKKVEASRRKEDEEVPSLKSVVASLRTMNRNSRLASYEERLEQYC